MISFLKKIPGFRSGTWWKTVIASIFSLSFLLTIFAVVLPSAPTLALDRVNPTNKSSVSIAGKTSVGKPVFLLQNNKVIQSIKADSSGKFYLVVSDLKDGNYVYTVEVCNSVDKDKCTSENILIIVDQTPPTKPVIALPDKLPDDSEEQITFRGVSDPNTKIIASIRNNELPAVTTNDKGDFELKTGLVLGANTIKVKAVDTLGNESE